MKICTTCNKEVSDRYVEFRCPGCGKQKVIRCEHCRHTSKAYKCPACGFEGP